MNLNKDDIQSKAIYSEDSIAGALYSGECRYGGGEIYVLQKKICYGISPYGSNCMKSDNPHSGIYEAETSRTLDLNGGNPACHQGGVIVLDAYNFETSDDVTKTLTLQRVDVSNIPIVLAEVHGVVLAIATQQSNAEITDGRICPTITEAAGTSGNNQPWICEKK